MFASSSPLVPIMNGSINKLAFEYMHNDSFFSSSLFEIRRISVNVLIVLMITMRICVELLKRSAIYKTSFDWWTRYKMCKWSGVHSGKWIFFLNILKIWILMRQCIVFRCKFFVIAVLLCIFVELSLMRRRHM